MINGMTLHRIYRNKYNTDVDWRSKTYSYTGSDYITVYLTPIYRPERTTLAALALANAAKYKINKSDLENWSDVTSLYE